MSLPLQGLHFKPQFKILLSKLRGCRRTWPPAHAARCPPDSQASVSSPGVAGIYAVEASPPWCSEPPWRWV